MTTIPNARVSQVYRNKRSWYDILKGHTGVDLAYKNEPLPSPVTGVVRQIVKQREMGLVLYLTDVWGATHVFAHLRQVDVVAGQQVKRGERIALTGNTGTVTSGPHLHYEIITARPHRTLDRIMSRSVAGIKGYNTDPLLYLQDLYKAYKVPYH